MRLMRNEGIGIGATATRPNTYDLGSPHERVVGSFLRNGLPCCEDGGPEAERCGSYTFCAALDLVVRGAVR